MKITADFTNITGKIKPMHGVGQPPLYGTSEQFFHYLKEAGMPFSRFHDVGGAYGGFRFADVPNIFRDFDADENDPASYDFVFTDWLVKALEKQNVEPFFRLGVTIENAASMRSYRVYPPKDFDKWARVCEHIVRHYNEGWADGMHSGIRYWEIWNEPENFDGRRPEMWRGTKEDYFRLYEVTANRLKECFGDSIRVGGYASCGFYSWQHDPDCKGIHNPGTDNQAMFDSFVDYAHEFLDYISSEEHHAPLDFYSWHTYSDPDEALRQEAYCRRLLEAHGYGDTEDILNEWNPAHTVDTRSTPMAAAKVLAMMLGMQKTKTGVLCYYDARIGTSQYGGLFNPDTWLPYRAYYAFPAFNSLYRLENEVETSSDDPTLYVGGAAKDGRSVLVFASLSDRPRTIELDVKGADLTDAEVVVTSGSCLRTLTGLSAASGKLTVEPWSCVEIRMNR